MLYHYGFCMPKSSKGWYILVLVLRVHILSSHIALKTNLHITYVFLFFNQTKLTLDLSIKHIDQLSCHLRHEDMYSDKLLLKFSWILVMVPHIFFTKRQYLLLKPISQSCCLRKFCA